MTTTGVASGTGTETDHPAAGSGAQSTIRQDAPPRLPPLAGSA